MLKTINFDGCDHEEYETNILTGRAECFQCGHRWYLSVDQALADMRCEAEYDKWQHRENRREFWRNQIYRILNRVWPRKSSNVPVDEEIPF